MACTVPARRRRDADLARCEIHEYELVAPVCPECGSHDFAPPEDEASDWDLEVRGVTTRAYEWRYGDKDIHVDD